MVGAGAVGTAVALRVAQSGASVLVLDAAHPAGGLSAHSFAWANPVDNGSAAYWTLTAEGMAAHRRLADLTGGPPWLFRTGNLHWADSPEDAEQVVAVAEAFRARDYRVGLLQAPEVRAELEPELRLDPVVGPVAYYPDDLHLYPDRMLSAVRDRARRIGVEFRLGDPVTGLLLTGDRVTGVRTGPGERVPADLVISCAGRGSTALLREVGGVPLVPPGAPDRLTAGLLVRTAPGPATVRRVVHAPGLSIRPHPGGRLVLHAHDLDHGLHGDEAPDAPVVTAAVDTLLRRLDGVLRGAAGTGVESVFVGVRPMPRDGMSVIGPLPGVRSLYAVITHSGLTLSSVLAEIVAAEVAGAQQPLAAPFRPDRFRASA